MEVPALGNGARARGQVWSSSKCRTPWSPRAGTGLSLLIAFAEIAAKVSNHMNGAVYGFLLNVPLSKNVVSSKWRLFVGAHWFGQISWSGKPSQRFWNCCKSFCLAIFKLEKSVLRFREIWRTVALIRAESVFALGCLCVQNKGTVQHLRAESRSNL